MQDLYHQKCKKSVTEQKIESTRAISVISDDIIRDCSSCTGKDTNPKR